MAVPQSVLFQPLDPILGRLSHVRVLRALALHGGGLTPAELARRTDLSRRGVWNAIEALDAVGVVEPVGTGHSVPFRLRPDHPLGPILRRLFEDEANRADAVLSAIRSAAERLEPRPAAVWLFGSVARGEDRVASDVDLALIAGSDADARASAAELRERLAIVAEQWMIQPSVISLSRPQVEKLREEEAPFWKRLVEDAVPLLGPAPDLLGWPGG